MKHYFYIINMLLKMSEANGFTVRFSAILWNRNDLVLQKKTVLYM